MKHNNTLAVPKYPELIEATYIALQSLGGSGKNNEINHRAAEILMLSEEFITKLAEFGIGVKEIKDYEIDDEFFKKI